jgi:hypothetical protein
MTNKRRICKHENGGMCKHSRKIDGELLCARVVIKRVEKDYVVTPDDYYKTKCRFRFKDGLEKIYKDKLEKEFISKERFIELQNDQRI